MAEQQTERHILGDPASVPGHAAVDELADTIGESSIASPDERFLFHHAAEYCLERGWSVLPLNGKQPALPSWRAYQTRRPTNDEIRTWFGTSSGSTTYNIGIVTGDISELVVVDADTQDAATWWSEHFPVTPLIATTGRGIHMYYRTPGNATVRNRAGVLGRKIDIRGDGGYVVAPPSRHPDTGALYKWLAWDHYSLDEIPVFDPSWIVHTSPVRTKDNQRNGHCPVDGVVPSGAQEDVSNLIRRLDVEVTDRSVRDFAIVCELLRNGLSEAEIYALVVHRSKFKTGGDNYFRHTFQNAKRAVGG